MSAAVCDVTQNVKRYRYFFSVPNFFDACSETFFTAPICCNTGLFSLGPFFKLGPFLLGPFLLGPFSLGPFSLVRFFLGPFSLGRLHSARFHLASSFSCAS